MRAAVVSCTPTSASATVASHALAAIVVEKTVVDEVGVHLGDVSERHHEESTTPRPELTTEAPIHWASRAPVAQGIERAPPEREVAGSIPAGRIPAARLSDLA